MEGSAERGKVWWRSVNLRTEVQHILHGLDADDDAIDGLCQSAEQSQLRQGASHRLGNSFRFHQRLGHLFRQAIQASEHRALQVDGPEM